MRTKIKSTSKRIIGAAAAAPHVVCGASRWCGPDASKTGSVAKCGGERHNRNNPPRQKQLGRHYRGRVLTGSRGHDFDPVESRRWRAGSGNTASFSSDPTVTSSEMAGDDGDELGDRD